MKRKNQTWKKRVREVYKSLEELETYNRLYGTARRCGYKSAKAMWQRNTLIGGSIDPSDFGRATR